MKTMIIGPNDAGQRLDKFISKALADLPASLMYKQIRTKKIKVNRKRASPSQKLIEGDVIQLFISDEFFKENRADEPFMKLTPHIDVIYEDENIILCDKRAGMLVHPDESEQTNTLISHIKAHLYRKGEYDPKAENSFSPALCNRIDRNTAGIVIAAKNAESLRVINEKIKSREIKKSYLCAAHGHFEKDRDILSAYLIKDEKTNKVKIYKVPPRNGEDVKKVVTEYRVLAEKNDLSLIEVNLITGRTHQIRAHLAFEGHPLLGDGKYGINKEDRQKGYKHQALYSYKLTFDFKSDAGVLNYLKGKTFMADISKIYFAGEFEK